MKKAVFSSQAFLVYILLAVLILTLQNGAWAQTTEPVLIKVGDATVDAGSLVTVDITMESGDTEISLAGLNLAYDPTAFIVTACEGSDNINICHSNSPGQLRINGYYTPPTSGTSTLATLTIAGITDGTTDLAIVEITDITNDNFWPVDSVAQNGSITVIGNAPPPTPTAVPPTPLPGQPPVLIKAGSTTVDGDALSTMDVTFEAGLQAVGATTLDFTYNPNIATVIECRLVNFSGTCNIYPPGLLRIVGVNPNGISGTSTLATLTIAGVADGATELVLDNVSILADTIGLDLEYTIENGLITVTGTRNTPVPTPTATAISPLPTPTPTLTLEPTTEPTLEPTVTPPPPLSCGPLEQEAEEGELSGNWMLGDDSAASNGQYIYLPDTDVQVRSANINQHKASYCFAVTTPGTYRIQGSVYAEDERDNSALFTVNDLPADGYIWDIPINTSYDLSYANDRAASAGSGPVEVALEAGDHILDIFLREDGLRFDTIALVLTDDSGPVVPPPPPAGCQLLGQEAEDGDLFGSFVVVGNDDASGGQYIHVPDTGAGTGIGTSASVVAVRSNSPTTDVDTLSSRLGNRADYCITVEEAGQYHIRTLVFAPDNQANSFFVQVDGAPEEPILYDIFPVSDSNEDTSYVADYVSQRGGDDPLSVDLSPGDHTISFILREDGAQLDRFELEPVGIQSAAMSRPSASELRRNLVAEGELDRQDTNIFVPLITR